MKYRRKHFRVKTSTVPAFGLGLFAKVHIPKGVNIGAYGGDIIRSDDEESYLDSDYILEIHDDCMIVNEGPKATYTRFINHCYMPNCVFIVDEQREKAWVETTEAIEPDEELFADYGKQYWEAWENLKKNSE